MGGPWAGSRVRFLNGLDRWIRRQFPDLFLKDCAVEIKNVLIVTKDIERTRLFYHDLSGLEMILDNDGNMVLTEGMALQDEKIWREFLGRDIISKNNSSELYFREKDIEGLIEKLESCYPEVEYVNRLMTHSWGQKVVRFYDPYGNLIEVGTPVGGA